MGYPRKDVYKAVTVDPWTMQRLGVLTSCALKNLHITFDSAKT